LETLDEGLADFDSKGDDKLNLLTKKFKRNLKKPNYGKSKRLKSKDKEKVVCHQCKKPGHCISECLDLTSKEKYKKNKISWLHGRTWIVLNQRVKKQTPTS